MEYVELKKLTNVNSNALFLCISVGIIKYINKQKKAVL